MSSSSKMTTANVTVPATGTDPAPCVQFNARPYQVEILKKSKDQNTIVCLGTGTGKTFISVMLIKEKQGGINGSLEKGGKRTFFLVNTVPLVTQQKKVIEDHTSLNVGFYTGDMGVDFWNKDRWRIEFNKNDVLVMTAQILYNILTHAFFSLQNINLLILDECHNASGKHPYSKILQMFDNVPAPLQPHIMGLTASIINEKYRSNESEFLIKAFLERKMKELESRMRAVCMTCSDFEATARFATKPVETIKPYDTGVEVNQFFPIEQLIKELQGQLEKAHNEFKCEKKMNKVSRVSSLLDIERLLLDTGMRMQAVCDVAADATKYCKDILDDLGPLCAYEASKILLGQLKKHTRSRFNGDDLHILKKCSTILNSVVTKFEHAVSNTDFGIVANVIPMGPFITKKAHVFLTDILLKEKRNFQEQFNQDLHAIVFVQRRCTAIILSQLINLQVQADFDTFGGMVSEYVLGHGLDANIRLADSYMKSKEQDKILNRFKKGEFNVLVATSVVEEGLDVRKCNLVVRFDGFNNYREYAQSKGRARAQNSKFIVMAKSEESQDMNKQLKVMQTIEKVLFEKCQTREQPTEREISDAMFDEIEEFIPTYYGPRGRNGPRITHDTCIALLYRYCNLLPHDQYSSTDPNFDYSERGYLDADKEYEAVCILPLNCKLPERMYKSIWLPSKEFAKQHVSMEICKLLHQHQMLDDENLLPIKELADDSDEEDDDDGTDNKKKKEGTRQSRDFYKRKIPEVLSPKGKFLIDNCDLYAVSLTLSEPYNRPSSYPHWGLWYDSDARGFGIYLPKGLPEIEPFALFTKAGEIKVEFYKLQHRTAEIDQNTVEKFHQKIMKDCSSKYTAGDLSFDIDVALDITKGLVVPLKASVFELIQTGRKLILQEPIDVKEMHQILRKKKVIIDNISSFDIQNAVLRKTYGDENQTKRLYYSVGLSESKGGDCMEGSKKTFAEYYQEKYERIINPNSLMLNVVLSSMKISYANDNSYKESKKQAHKELLVPKLCERASDIPADLHLRMQYIPYALYMMECIISAQNLNCSIADTMEISMQEKQFNVSHDWYIREENVIEKLRTLLCNTANHSPSSNEILQCLTTRQAKFGFDLERLEMLGDSFLKQAVTVYLFYNYPDSDEGKLSTKRKRCISNKNLSRIAKRIELQNMICNSQFGCSNSDSQNTNPKTVWLPPGFQRTATPQTDDESMETEDITSVSYQDVQDKSLADCVEALIGAYFKTGGVDLALKFMQEYLHLDVLFQSITDGDTCKIKAGTVSSYADYPQVQPIHKKNVASKMYARHKLDRLEEKLNYQFQEKSHIVRAMTHLSYATGEITGCYQEYEFLGDAILDFLVTLHVYINKPNLSPGDLTSLRSALVNNNTFALLTIKHDFHKFMFQLSPALFSAYDEFVKLVKDGDGLESCFASPFVIVPPGSDIGYHAPKVLGDLFESVAGGLFLDSRLDLVKVWTVYYPIMKPVIDKYMDDIPINPARELQETYADCKLEYIATDEKVTCTVKIPGKEEVYGIGQNKKIAKATAAKRALDKYKKS